MPQATFKIWRGQGTAATFVDYTTEFENGMVVLDVVHRIQAAQANDLAVRWNCKAGKCVVLGGNQRPAASDVHDADERHRHQRAGDGAAHAHLSARKRSGDGRFLELSGEGENQALQA